MEGAGWVRLGLGRSTFEGRRKYVVYFRWGMGCRCRYQVQMKGVWIGFGLACVN